MKSVRWRSDDEKERGKENILMTTRTERDGDVEWIGE